MLAKRRLAAFGILSIAILICVPTSPLGGLPQTPIEQTHKLWGVYWSAERGFSSVLEMKNNRPDRAVTVHVSLYFLSGEEHYLTAETLGPRETKALDLNRALEALPRSVAARASREGTLEVEFDAATSSAVMGSVSVSNPEKRLAWNFFLYPAGGTEVQPLRGVFWLPNHKADGFVAIQNVSEENVRVEPTFHAAGTKHGLEPVYLAAGQGLKLDLRRELRKLGLNKSDAGGLELAYSGPPGALRAHGVLFDGRGFSTEIDFLAYGEAAEPRTFAYRTPRFAIGTADPKLGLPRRTSFQSYLVLHNFNGYLHDLDIFVAGQQGNDLREVKRSVSLPAGETRVLDVAKEFPELKALKTAWASMEVSYTGRHNGVGMMLASVSDSGEYSIRSVLNWVQASTREGWIWRADANQNTLLGIYNADSEPAPVNLSIDYHSGGQRSSYDMPLTIPPRASELLDIGEIVSGGQPDSDGDLIPQGVTLGGYRAVKIGPRANVTIVTEALIYDRSGREFLTIYNTGCCYSTVTFRTTNVNALVGDTSQLKWEGDDVCLNQWVDITDQASFNSLNGLVAKLTLEPGQLLHPSAGTTTVNTQVFYFRFHPDECAGVTAFGSCSVRVRPQVTGVTPPRGVIGNATSVTISGIGFGSNPTVNAGNGIAVNITSKSDTTIQATFDVATTAPGGNHQVTVTAGGQASQQSVNFFVQVPTSLGVVSTTVIPTGATGGCTVSQNFGIRINTRYQLRDQSGSAITSSTMQPQETLTNWVLNGQSQGDPAPDWVDIGPSEVSGTSQFTDSSGQFVDAPFGICGTTTFSSSFAQSISVLIGGQTRFVVRTHSISVSSTSAGQGNLSNGSDIIVSR